MSRVELISHESDLDVLSEDSRVSFFSLITKSHTFCSKPRQMYAHQFLAPVKAGSKLLRAKSNVMRNFGN
jgi:hypothetical protein